MLLTLYNCVKLHSFLKKHTLVCSLGIPEYCWIYTTSVCLLYSTTMQFCFSFLSFIFSLPVQCNVRLLLWDVVCLSSVTRIYCGQTVSWIRMPLGTEVGLGLSDIVLGDPAPPTQRGTAALLNFFGPCLLWPNRCMDQDASWYADWSLLVEAIFSTCHTNPNPTHSSLAFVMGANRRA